MSKQVSQQSSKKQHPAKPIKGKAQPQLQLVEKVQMESQTQAAPEIPQVPNTTAIIPFLSCYAEPEHFEEATKSFYSEIYTSTPDGNFLKHVKLSHGRHVRLKVSALPKGANVDIKSPQPIQEELNFLPGGKIPYTYFEQIVAFFRKVMEVKKADFEAHSYIMWSVKDKHYYIHIPKQIVSKASVQFTYDMPEGDVIVCDIHSHNTMGAFYSGTDENNDKSNICYSGVIGRITPTSYEYVMRFNLYEAKKRCGLDEVFDVPPKPESLVPKEWLDNVEVRTFTAPAQGGTSTGRYNPPPAYGGGGVVHTVGRGGTASKIPDLRSASQRILSGPLVRDSDGQLGHQTRSLWDEISASDLNGGGGLYSSLENVMGTPEDIYINPKTGCVEARPDEAVIEEEEDPVGDNTFLTGEFEHNVREYGMDLAEAKDSIDTDICQLEGQDELLLDVIRNAYGMLTTKGQDDLATNGF